MYEITIKYINGSPAPGTAVTNTKPCVTFQSPEQKYSDINCLIKYNNKPLCGFEVIPVILKMTACGEQNQGDSHTCIRKNTTRQLRHTPTTVQSCA